MRELHGTWCLQCEGEGWVWVNGEVVNKKFLSYATLDALKVSGGVQCGLLCTCMYMCKYHGGNVNCVVSRQ